MPFVFLVLELHAWGKAHLGAVGVVKVLDFVGVARVLPQHLVEPLQRLFAGVFDIPVLMPFARSFPLY